jgi:cytochrome c553
MIRHIIAAIAAALTIAAILYMAKLDSEVHKLQMIHEIIEKSKMEVKLPQQSATQQPKQQVSAKKEESEAEKKLKVLKEKAGRMSAFEVSPLYRRNCASCHGINGEGGIGPKLVGKSEEYIYQALEDFRTGKRKNYVMYGLLQNMKDEQLKELAKEIASFAEKLKAAE